MNDESNSEVPTLPQGCGYTGYDFGGGYIDSQCFGGRLYDLDDCDEPGGMLYEPLEFIPCPKCNHEEWIKSLLKECEEKGAIAKSDGLPRECPYVAEKLRYPEDLPRYVAAWNKGWDETEL